MQAPSLRHVGRYAILGELGRGGMAAVYLARQDDLDRLVALKELVPMADPRIARRFLLESRLAGSLAHPNVVVVHDRFEADGTFYIAMEYVAGGPLRPYIGRLSCVQSVAVLEGVLAGLAHAESHEIVHRDMKPENVMVTVEGGVKIADFGIAKVTGELWSGTRLTASGMTLGTPAYIAPEQAMARPVGPPADLYSVGCMAYEMFTGRIPFDGTDTPMAMLLCHVNDEPAPAADVAPGVDRRISDWIAGLLHKDPSARPQRAEHAWQQLEEIVIALEGPRWRRLARLPVVGPEQASPEPSGFVDRFPGPRSEQVIAEPSGFASQLPPSARQPTGGSGAWYEAREPAPAEPVAVASEPAPVPAATTPADPVTATIARRSRLGPRIATAVTLLALVGGLAATAPGNPAPRPRTPPTPPPAGPLMPGKLRLQPPVGWSPLTPPLHIPGLDLIDPVSLVPSGGARAGAAVIGIAPRSAHRRALLPVEFERALGTLPTAAPVGLRGDLDALRYDGLRPPGLGRAVTVYAVPTSAGVATVACVGDSRAVAAPCRRIAGSLHVPGGNLFAVGPSRPLGGAIDDALRRLAVTLRTGRRGLLGAGRATAATAISAGYRDAFAAIEAVDVSPADEAVQRPLLAALRTAGRAYSDLAEAARATGRGRYRAAATRAERGEQKVLAAQRELREDGYRELIADRFRTAAIPPLPPPPSVEPYIPPVRTVTPYPTAVVTPKPKVYPPRIEIGDCNVAC